MSNPKGKCIFYDMLHSNNSARIRIWLRLMGGLEDQVQRVLVGHHELHEGVLEAVNPLKKVPALKTDTGLCLFESFVILEYLQDRYGNSEENMSGDRPRLILDTPEDRAFVQLLVRVHDLYIASPNCTQPQFAHTQGCMYLDEIPTKYTPASRTMDVNTRAAKLKEIYKQLSWLERQIKLPFMAGSRISHADCTWFPTCIFMELLLPYVFGWAPIFHEDKHFPNLTKWFTKCKEHPAFLETYNEVHGTLTTHQKDGRFELVRQIPKEHTEYQWKHV